MNYLYNFEYLSIIKKGGVKMIIKIKLKFEEEQEINLKDICDENTIIFTYSERQLKEIRKTIFKLIDNENLSSEQIEECRTALEIIKNTLYINNRINIKNLDVFYIKTLSNNDLISFRNSIIKILNQHIILYEETMLPLYSRMIDVCAVALIIIKKEMNLRKLKEDMTRREKRDLEYELTKWNCKYPITRFY